MTEREVLEQQLGELTRSLPTDHLDAVELATIAGLAARAGLRGRGMDKAEQWRDGKGWSLITAVLDEDDFHELIDDLEEALKSEATDGDKVEELLFGFDDLVAGAAWAGRESKAEPAVVRLMSLVAECADDFDHSAELAAELWSLEAVQRNPALYRYLAEISRIGS